MPPMRCLVVAVLAFFGSVWVLVLPHLLGLTGVWLWAFALGAAVPVGLIAGVGSWLLQMPDVCTLAQQEPDPWRRVVPAPAPALSPTAATCHEGRLDGP